MVEPHRPDVLVSGPERAPLPRRSGLAVRAVALLALATAAAGVDQARDQRAVLAEERRLASALELEVVPGPGLEQWGRYDAERRAVEVDVVVHVRNDGPREVRVVAGRLGPFALGEQVALAPGAVGTLVLGDLVACWPYDPPRPVEADALDVAVRTGAGLQQVALATELRSALAGRACAAAS